MNENHFDNQLFDYHLTSLFSTNTADHFISKTIQDRAVVVVER